VTLEHPFSNPFSTKIPLKRRRLDVCVGLVLLQHSQYPTAETEMSEKPRGTKGLLHAAPLCRQSKCVPQIEREEYYERC
jgi:hypothetical protein